MKEERPGDRLRKIREEKMKFATASQAARFLNVATPTYLSHENGTRKISAEWADLYSEAYRISPAWLLYKRGAPDDENTFVGQVASNAAAQRQPARMQISNPLLSVFEVNYGADGALHPLPGVRNFDAPAWLPTVAAANGFIAELVYVAFPERESRRLVRIGGPDVPQSSESDVLFGLDDFVRLPPDMVGCDMAFAVRIRTADLVEGASGYDRAIIDATERVPFKSAFYYVVMNKRASLVYLVPIYENDRANYPEHLRIHETRFDRPTVLPSAAVQVLGRVVTMIMTMSEQMKANFTRQLFVEGEDTKAIGP